MHGMDILQSEIESFSLFKNNNSKLISLAGDTHNAWFSKLFNNAEEHIGYEFGTPSVTSPGLSEYLNGVNPENSSKELLMQIKR